MKTFVLSQIIETSGVKFGTSGARGLVAQMTNEVCYAYAQAFWQAAGSGDYVVIGHDLRPSSPAMTAACIAAFNDLGIKVCYAGALPTPALAYFAQLLAVPALIVTGSHIPFDRNGIKFYRAEGEITKADEAAMLQAQITVPDNLTPAPLPKIDKRVEQTYIQRYVDFFGAGGLTGKRVAVYEHSSVARDVLRKILQALGADVLSLGRTDTFVPIDTEAVRAEDIAQAAAWAKQHDFDALFSTDGDADRPLIGDENGVWLRGDIVGILCAQYLHADVVVTPVSSNTAVEKCASFNRVLRTRIGSPYVIAAMQTEQGAVVGYEANGGFLLGSDVTQFGNILKTLPTRDAVLPMLALLALSKQRNCKLSELSQNLPQRYTYSDRLQNFPTETSLRLIADMQQNPALIKSVLAPDAGDILDINNTDGLRVTFVNGEIVHLRPSGNAPELRCYVEADSADRAKGVCDRCLFKNINITPRSLIFPHTCKMLNF